MIAHIGPGDLISQATVHNGIAYLSGQVALDARTADLATQTQEVFERIDALLDEVGSGRGRILAATVWLADLADFADYNRLWRDWLGTEARPARATVGAQLALDGLRIEIQITAAVAPPD